MDASLLLSRKIGQRIKHLRVSEGLKQSYLAEELNMSKTGYGNIERGQTHITVDRLQEIADFFKIPVHSFFKNEHALKKDDEIVSGLVAKQTLFKTLLKEKPNIDKLNSELQILSEELDLLIKMQL